MESLSEKFNQSLNINADDLEQYHRYRQEGKEAAQRGELGQSLELFQQAYELQPSAKLQNRIQRLQEAIQELTAAEEEEEEQDEDEAFVDVNGSGLMLYKDLYNKLYEHQREGVAFLYSLHRDSRKGGILADDMGLGKTIQVISFLSGMYDSELANQTLLIMPTSLIKNWVQEFTKWTPGMRVKEFHGTSRTERNRNLERVQRKGGVVITTYQMLINNWEQLASYGGQEFCWDYVILDEAHKIKTSSTKTAKCAHAVPARHRLLLTGTPVQNNLREMWALFDFACKGSLLGTAKTFKAEYENPITRAREKDATPGEKALGLKISQNLMEFIRPYFLRRTKAEVQSRQCVPKMTGYEEQVGEREGPTSDAGALMPSLTRKNDLIVWTYLSPIQEDIYNQFISLDHIKQLLMSTCSPLAELGVLKKLCDHPRLLSARAVTQLGLEEGSSASPAYEEEEESSRESAASRLEHVPDTTLLEESGKLSFLLSLLERLREDGHRTLVFSQSRKMLDIMERVLRNRDFQLVRVDGTVAQLAERERRIALFQTDCRYTVFLLTTQVGGVGLTLTAANRVVIFDPSWNPATDAQAVDRAYRIGQTENVVIYRLITCGTVEEKIYRRQVFKDSLIRQTTGDKKNPFRYFSKQELKELFTLEDTRSSSTQQQLQALHGQHRRSDPTLDLHIACLHTMEMFGISDHDLLFSREAGADTPQDAESHHYIETRVQKAQELVRAESELHTQLSDHIARSTEPAWLALARNCDGDEATGAGRRPPSTPRCPLPTVDLTQSGSDDHTQEVNSEVEIVSGDGEESVGGGVESVLSGDAAELSSQVVQDSERTGESSRISGRDDRLDLTQESCEQDLEEQDRDQGSPTKVEHSSLHPESGDNSVVLVTGGNSQLLPQHTSLLGRMDSSKALLGAELDASVASMETELDASMACVEAELDASMACVEAEPFQGNFNLQLEDSADMFVDEEEEKGGPSVDDEEEEGASVNEEEEGHPSVDDEEEEGGASVEVEEAGTTVEEEEAGASVDEEDEEAGASVDEEDEEAGASVDEEEEEGGASVDDEGLLLPMEVSGGGLVKAGESDGGLHCASPAQVQSMVEDDSMLCVVSQKKKAQVIYDSEEEEEKEKPCLASSPLASCFTSSTPKATLTKSAPRRRSMNTSVVLRLSLVEFLLEDMEDEDMEEEEACSSAGACLSQASEAHRTSVDQSEEEEEQEGNSAGACLSQASEVHGTSVDGSVEEEEINGETLSSESTDELEVLTCEDEGDEEEESALVDWSADVELASSEIMEQFAAEPSPDPCAQLASLFVEVPQETENTYESLVLSGKRSLSEGKKKQALDLFLKAIDINSGDGEVQLLIIQLYRQLSEPKP